jgi:hypothetical protein
VVAMVMLDIIARNTITPDMLMLSPTLMGE